MKKKEYIKPQIEMMEYTPTQLLIDSSSILIPFTEEVVEEADWFSQTVLIQAQTSLMTGLGLFLVRSAWALSNVYKSLSHPNSGKAIAQGKGVHREVESEGSRRQTSGPTNRNFIQGIWPWMRLPNKSKSHSYSERLV